MTPSFHSSHEMERALLRLAYTASSYNYFLSKAKREADLPSVTVPRPPTHNPVPHLTQLLLLEVEGVWGVCLSGAGGIPRLTRTACQTGG